MRTLGFFIFSKGVVLILPNIGFFIHLAGIKGKKCTLARKKGLHLPVEGSLGKFYRALFALSEGLAV